MAITSAVGGEHKLGTPIAWIRPADNVAVGLKMLNVFRHCLFSHLSPLSEQAHLRRSCRSVMDDRLS